MSRFEYHEPESLRDAIALAARFGTEASFLAGGTDLIVQLERGRIAPRHVIGLRRVPGLTGIEVNGRVTLGARVTPRAIERAPELAGAFRCLIEGAEVIGGHQVRNVATVGGNLVNASPAADGTPPLLAHDAEVLLAARRNGTIHHRKLALSKFVEGPGRTALGEDEILLEVQCAALPKHGAAFEKVGQRRSLVISTVCVAALVELDDTNRKLADVRLAVAGIGPVPRRMDKIEAALKGQMPSARLLEDAAAIAGDLVASRTRQEYRREVVRGFVLRALVNAARRAGANDQLITPELEALYA